MRFYEVIEQTDNFALHPAISLVTLRTPELLSDPVDDEAAGGHRPERASGFC